MKRLQYALCWAGLMAAVPGALASYKVEWRSDALETTEGGADSGFTHISQLDVAIEFETGGLFGEKATWLASAFYNNGNSFTNRVGDLQVVSSIEADGQGLRLNEAWVDQPLPSGIGSVLIGRYDLNGEFDVIESALPFVNSAFGIGTDLGQSGVNGPSIFPATGLATRLRLVLNDQWQAKLAIIEGIPGNPDDPGSTYIDLDGDEGALIIAEATYDNGTRKLMGGFWRYTRTPEPVCQPADCGARIDDNFGLYFRGETRLMQTAFGPIDGFFRVGSAAGEFNPFDRFYSLGILMDAPFPTRQDDRLGIALAYGMASDEFRRGLRATGTSPASREGVIELTWVASLAPNLTLQPTVQFIDNPGADRAIDDAWTVGLRVQLAFP